MGLEYVFEGEHACSRCKRVSIVSFRGLCDECIEHLISPSDGCKHSVKGFP